MQELKEFEKGKISEAEAGKEIEQNTLTRQRELKD